LGAFTSSRTEEGGRDGIDHPFCVLAKEGKRSRRPIQKALCVVPLRERGRINEGSKHAARPKGKKGGTKKKTG